MNFDLDDAQGLLERTLGRYFTEQFPASRVREVFEGSAGWSEELWRFLADMGLFWTVVPDDLGGTGRGILDLAVAAECLGASAAPGPFVEHALAVLAFAISGDAAVRRDLLPRLAAGELRATFAVAESGGRWRPHELAMGGDTIVGEKSWVLNGGDADIVVVALRDGMVVVEGGERGLSCDPVEALDRTRRFVTLRFDGVAHRRLACGADAVERVVDAGAVLLAADAFGGAKHCLDAAVAYANQREQFGVTIGHFQAIKHQLADIALAVEPTRGLYWYAAHAFDHAPEDASRFPSLAKAHISDRYVDAARRAIEIHGGIGYTWECDLHFYLRRALFDRAYLGGPEAHRERFAALTGWSGTRLTA